MVKPPGYDYYLRVKIYYLHQHKIRVCPSLASEGIARAHNTLTMYFYRTGSAFQSHLFLILWQPITLWPKRQLYHRVTVWPVLYNFNYNSVVLSYLLTFWYQP